MRRCLIVANRTLTGHQLMAEVVARHESAPRSFHIVVPAAHENATRTEGQALAQARDALDDAIAHFSNEGLEVTGEVGEIEVGMGISEHA